MKLKFSLFASAITLMLFTSCESEYSKQVKAELAKGVRKDSILLGINLADTRQDFYGKCFDLNKKQLVIQGPSGTSVQYMFVDSLVHNPKEEIRMLFAPNFDDSDHIAELQVELSYTAWAPWNKKYQSDSLKVKTLEMLSAWYGGNPFVTADINDKQIPVKVDGNRRIIVDVKDGQSVRVRFQDLLNPKFQHSITKNTNSKD